MLRNWHVENRIKESLGYLTLVSKRGLYLFDYDYLFQMCRVRLWTSAFGLWGCNLHPPRPIALSCAAVGWTTRPVCHRTPFVLCGQRGGTRRTKHFDRAICSTVVRVGWSVWGVQERKGYTRDPPRELRQETGVHWGQYIIRKSHFYDVIGPL